MSAMDRVLCDYPLPDPRDQDREFVTGDFGGFGNDQYVITRDGRLLRQAPARPRENAPVRDVEWPIEGDIRIFEEEDTVEAPIEYAVRFRAGRVEWIRRVRMDPPEVLPGAASASRQIVPEAMGRPGSAEEFLASVPRKEDRECVADLVGSLRGGAPDLSSNKRRLKGFGRRLRRRVRSSRA